MILHEETTFLVCASAGNMGAELDDGFYFEDTRFLTRYAIALDGQRLHLLNELRPSDDHAIHVASNPELDHVETGTLVLTRHSWVAGGLHEDLSIESFAEGEAAFCLTLSFDADFEHVFRVKQANAAGHDRPRRAHRQSRWILNGGPPALELSSTPSGTGEHLRRATTIRLSRAAKHEEDGTVARFDVKIPHGGSWTLAIDVDLHVSESRFSPHPSAATGSSRFDAAPRLETDHAVLGDAYARAVRDVGALRLKAEGAASGEHAVAAGIPWYIALFGRDSLIASYQTMLLDPALAKGTLGALARMQGTKVDPETQEQPGRILHEYRKTNFHGPRGEWKFPYYGTIDATPLFLVTLSEYVRVTGDLDLADQLWGNVERALAWMENYGDRDGDLLIEYLNQTEVGLRNEAWKDSGDSYRFRDGTIARPPIASIEVQGYASDALDRVAELSEALGHRLDEDRIRARAASIRQKIDALFWVEDRRYFAEALDARKRRVDAVTSNPGQLLWSGAVDRTRLVDLRRMLMSDAMASGYGIRTMASDELAFNPISYHNGSVWPHDTVLIAAGMARYGLANDAGRILAGLLAAAAAQPHMQLPELFSGYARAGLGSPIDYPGANRPQAWASGAMVMLTHVLAGIEVNALERRIRVRPIAIEGMKRLAFRGLPIGGAEVDLAVDYLAHGARARVSGAPPDWTVDVPGSEPCFEGAHGGTR